MTCIKCSLCPVPLAHRVRSTDSIPSQPLTDGPIYILFPYAVCCCCFPVCCFWLAGWLGWLGWLADWLTGMALKNGTRAVGIERQPSYYYIRLTELLFLFFFFCALAFFFLFILFSFHSFFFSFFHFVVFKMV